MPSLSSMMEPATLTVEPGSYVAEGAGGGEERGVIKFWLGMKFRE